MSMSGQVRLTCWMGLRSISAWSSALAAFWRWVASIMDAAFSLGIGGAFEHGQCGPVAAGLAGDRRLGQRGLAGLDDEMVVQRVPGAFDVRCGWRLAGMQHVLA